MASIRVTAGLFRHVFKFENPVKTGNTSGGRTEDYIEFYTARGYMKQLSGHVSFNDGYDGRIENYELICYWRSALENEITKDTRVVYDNKFFRIDRAERMSENRQYYKFELVKE